MRLALNARTALDAIQNVVIDVSIYGNPNTPLHLAAIITTTTSDRKVNLRVRYSYHIPPPLIYQIHQNSLEDLMNSWK